MLTDHSHQLLKCAATESLERIRLDRSRAPQRLKPLLAYIEEHLFDPKLDVNQLKRSCGVRDNSVPIQFHSAVGRPPHGYIEDRRLETACKMLAETNLKIWQISELLGYSSIQVFSRAFSRWSGQRPTLYRKKARRRGAASRDSALAALGEGEATFFDKESLRRALAGELSAQEATLLIERLLQLYPSCRESLSATPDDGDPASDDDEDGGNFFAASFPAKSTAPQAESPLTVQLKVNEIDRLRAEEILRELEKHSPERQLAMIQDMRLTTPTLFVLLRERSREVGREEPQRGVELAELALNALDVFERSEKNKKLLANLRAQGYVCLANARCLASDFVGAEKAFKEADPLFRTGGRLPEVEADIALHKASLRRDQRRFTEARELLERALVLYQQLGQEDQINKVLIVQATVVYEEGDPAAAIPYLQQVLERLDEESDGVITLSLFHNLTTAYTESGRHAEAVELLPKARRLTLTYGGAYHKIRLRWLEGSIFREIGRYAVAETALLEARDSFIEIEDAVDAALVCLDLAELYWQQGRAAELEELSASMIPLFGNLQHHREALVSLKLLQQAVEEQRVTGVLLQNARVALKDTRHRRFA